MIGYYVTDKNGDFTDSSPYRSESEAKSEADEICGTIEWHLTDIFNNDYKEYWED